MLPACGWVGRTSSLSDGMRSVRVRRLWLCMAVSALGEHGAPSAIKREVQTLTAAG